MTEAETPEGSTDEKHEQDPLAVADPEQYNQNQRLKEIHEARREVRKALGETKFRAERPELQNKRAELANAVTVYVMELEPLIRKADLDSEYLELPEHHDCDNILEFAAKVGITDDKKNGGITVIGRTDIMEVFRKCNLIMSELGLGAELSEGTDHADIDEFL